MTWKSYKPGAIRNLILCLILLNQNNYLVHVDANLEHNFDLLPHFEFPNCVIVKTMSPKSKLSLENDALFQFHTAPTIVADGNISISLVHYRKQTFCILYLVMFPETIGSEIVSSKDKFWPIIYLERVGIRLRNKWVSETKIADTELLEAHYMIVVTGVESLDEIVAPLVDYSGTHLATSYILQWNNQDKLKYICKPCHPNQQIIVVDIPISGIFIQEELDGLHPLKSFLDKTEMQITNFGTNARFQYPGEVGIYPKLDHRFNIKITANATLQSPFYSTLLTQNSENYRYIITYILMRSGLTFPILENDTIAYLTSNAIPFTLYPTMNNYFQDSRLWMATSHKVTVTLTSHVFLEDPKFFNFLTCDGNSNAKEDMLLHALPDSVWVMVGCIYILCTILLTILSRKRRNRKQIGLPESFLNSAELLLNYVLEQGDLDLRSSLGTNNDTSISSKYCSATSLLVTLLLSWAMTVLLMNNVYKSYVTSDESVLLRTTAKYETFNELVQDKFSIVSPLIYEHYSFQNRTDEADMKLTTFGETLVHLWNELDAKKNGNETLLLRKKYSGLMDQFVNYGGRNRGIYYNNYKAFYKFLEKCNRTAFVHLDKGLGEYLYQFNGIGDNRFVFGKDKFPAPADAWYFENYNPVFVEKIYNRLSWLIQSGIYELFKRCYDEKKEGGGGGKNNELRTYLRSQLVYNQQKLVGPLLIFFGTIGKLLGIGGVIFLVEIVVNHFRSIMWKRY